MMEGIWLVLEDEFYGKDKILKAFETHKKAFDFINSRLLEVGRSRRKVAEGENNYQIPDEVGKIVKNIDYRIGQDQEGKDQKTSRENPFIFFCLIHFKN